MLINLFRDNYHDVALLLTILTSGNVLKTNIKLLRASGASRNFHILESEFATFLNILFANHKYLLMVR